MTDASRPTVLVTTRFFDQAAEQWLESLGFCVRRSGLAYNQVDTDLSNAELRVLLDGVKGWIVGVAPVSRALLADFPDLKVIARRGVGYNNVDTQAAAELGKFVTIAPGGNEHSVADHTLAMMLALAKRLRDGHMRMASGDWNAVETTELYDKTVGLLGFGRIAQLVARRVKGFDARVVASDPYADPATASRLGVALVDFDTLLSQSDYLSLHLPLTDATRNILNANTFSRMKPTAIIVNTSRDGMIDEIALQVALANGKLGGAALDVFCGESDPSRRSHAAALLRLPNFIGSAHSAGSSREGLARTNLISARCVADLLSGDLPPHECLVVNPKI